MFPIIDFFQTPNQEEFVPVYSITTEFIIHNSQFVIHN